MPTHPTVQQALQQARPLVRRQLNAQTWAFESLKGCCPIFAKQPVALTPPLDPIPRADQFGMRLAPLADDLPRQDQADKGSRQRVWFNLAVNPEHPPRARESESFLRVMSGARHGFIFEVAGNEKRIDLRVGLDETDTPTLKVAMLALNLSMGEGRHITQRLPLRTPSVTEFVPRPPYADAFTRLDELPHAPVGLMVKALHSLPEECLGLYQVCIAPVHDDRWAHNAQLLHDARFKMRLEPSAPQGMPDLSWTQQVPGGNLTRLTQDTYLKTHSDRAFYFALSRVAVWSFVFDSETAEVTDHTLAKDEVSTAQLRCLSAPMCLIRQGGRPLDPIPPETIASSLRPNQIASMLEDGNVHRHGVLLNSEELAAWVHLPPLEIIETLHLNNLRREPLVPKSPVKIGTRLGVCIDGEHRIDTRVEPKHRARHSWLIGKNGTGKSTLLQSMSLDDASRGDGALIIDPHGQMVRELADRLPEAIAQRTFWIDFEDEDQALLFNPLRAGGVNQPPPRVADHFIGAFKAMTGGWGDRLEHILRHLIIAAAMLPNGSLLDVVQALERDSEGGEQIRQRMAEVCTDEIVLRFLRNFRSAYKSVDVNPAYHKLSKLLLSGPASLSLRQPDNRLDISSWMEHGNIVLADLGSISGEFKHLIGSFLIASTYTAALARRKPRHGKLRPFHVFADEAHRFSNELLAGMIAETRKFNVDLTLAHQYLSQFSRETVSALGTAGTCVVFNVDIGDAEYLSKSMQKRVDASHISALRDFEAYARIGSQPLHLQTPHYSDLPEGDNQFEQIRDRSFKHWYAPRRKLEAQVNDIIAGRQTQNEHTQVLQNPPPKETLPDTTNWPPGPRNPKSRSSDSLGPR